MFSVLHSCFLTHPKQHNPTQPHHWPEDVQTSHAVATASRRGVSTLTSVVYVEQSHHSLILAHQFPFVAFHRVEDLAGKLAESVYTEEENAR